MDRHCVIFYYRMRDKLTIGVDLMISNYYEIMKHKLIMLNHHFNITTQSCSAAVPFRVMCDMFIVETNAPHTNQTVKCGIQH